MNRPFRTLWPHPAWLSIGSAVPDNWPAAGMAEAFERAVTEAKRRPHKLPTSSPSAPRLPELTRLRRVTALGQCDMRRAQSHSAGSRLQHPDTLPQGQFHKKWRRCRRESTGNPTSHRSCEAARNVEGDTKSALRRTPMSTRRAPLLFVGPLLAVTMCAKCAYASWIRCDVVQGFGSMRDAATAQLDGRRQRSSRSRPNLRAINPDTHGNGRPLQITGGPST